MQAKGATPMKNEKENGNEEKTEKMEEDECQDRIDENMRNFLNAGGEHVGSASSSSSSSASQSQPKIAEPLTAGTRKSDLADLKQEMIEMMKAMEERQNRAEQRQDVAEKRIEGAITEIVTEQKALAASTTQDVGDLKSMLAMMMQQQNALVQQQTTMMQMLQGDERRVKPKVEAQTPQ